jgi:hypothetical protein
MSYYENPHYSQYEASGAIVRSQGCTATTGSNGADACSGGKIKKTPDQVWALIPENEQQNPSTPGWSLVDLDRAMQKLGVLFTNRSGQPWAKVLEYLEKGYYVALQGVCAELGGCSGFMGDHCLGVHPFQHSTKGWRNDEPTKADYGYYSTSKLRQYAVAFSGSENSIYFGTFDVPVPQTGGTMARFVQANGYGAGSGKLLTVTASAPWFYLDGSSGGTFSKGAKISVYGLVDGTLNKYLAEISTSKPYADGQTRDTLIIVESPTPLENVPVIPPADEIAARQRQWDADAVAAIGPRPT